MGERSHRLPLGTLVLLVPAAMVASCGSSADDRYVDLQPGFGAPSEPFAGAVTSIEPPFVERADGGRSWEVHRIVFHVSQRAAVEQFRLGAVVRATAYEISLPCDCGPDEIPPRGLMLTDIEVSSARAQS